MSTVNREEKYCGHNNDEIHKYNKRILKLRKEILELEEKIQAIRDNCDHYFQFWSSGMYEDSYYCKHCGEEKDI